MILVMLMLAALPSCRSERDVTSHEGARWQRAVLDSTATHVDSLARRDRVSLRCVASGLSLEVDSVDWHLTWDSAGRVASVSGRRLVSRRSSSARQKAAVAEVEERHVESRRQRAMRDSLSHDVVEDKHVETVAGWRRGWLELACSGVVLVLAVGVVIHLRETTERWSKRR